MPSNRWIAAVLAGCALTAAAAVAPGSADAANRYAVQHATGAATAPGVPVHPHTTSPLNDEFLAGYYSYENAGLTSASATFKLPAITCSSTDTMDLGFGVFGIPTGATDLSDSRQADGQVDCIGGSPYYYISAYTPVGGNNYVAANAGDKIIASLSENGSQVTATVHDVTTGVTVTSTGDDPFDTQVNTGAYNYYYPGRIPTFNRVTISKAQVNGDYLGYTASYQLAMKPNRRIQIDAGALNRAGDGFALLFKNSAS
jgi:hypothetical protein